LYVSLNEIDAAVKRAARGIGLSWGLADEAGRSARWLAAHRVVGLDIVLAALLAHEGRNLAAMGAIGRDGEWHADSGTLSPILAGARFSDESGRRGQDCGLALAEVIYPILMLPWVAWTSAATNDAFEMLWQDARILVSPVGIELCGPSAGISCSQARRLRIGRIAAAEQDEVWRERRVGVDVETSTWLSLQLLAYRSFVPGSERSRLTGAGAGLSDND
jgi:hypothetical protein